MKTTGAFIIRHKAWIVAVTLAATAFLAYFLKDLRVDPDVFNYLPDDDPKAALFREVGTKYGGNYIGIIGLETDDVFTPQALEQVRLLTDSIRFTDGVGSVTSLTNVIDIKSSEWGIEIGKLIDEYNIPQNGPELKALREYTLSQEMYRGTLVSEDATFTAIMVRINEGTDKIAVAGEIRKKAENAVPGGKLYFGGMPFAIQSLADIIMSDLLFLTPLTAAVIILLLFIGFRSWRGVLLPLLTVLISIIWTIGMMGLLKINITIISDAIPVILLAVGSAYTIHVINRINESAGQTYADKIGNAVDYIRVPVFLAAVTTMAGFISFIFGSYLTMISSFGIFMAAGVGFALLLSLTFSPALLAMFPEPKQTARDKGNRFMEKPLSWLAQRVTAHPGRIILVWLALAAAGGGGAFLVERKADVIDYFKRSDPTYVAEKTLREKFGGTMPVYVRIKGDIQSPEVLREMESLTVHMKDTYEISNAQSVADLVMRMNDVMKEGKRVPDSKLKVEQLWFLLEGQDVMEQLVNFEKDEAMINATFNSGDLKTISDFTASFQEFIDKEYPPIASGDSAAVRQVDFSGYPSLYINIDKSLLKSQMQSILYATLLVLLIVSIVLRSPRLGSVTIVPILATLIILFGFMGFAGIPLDVATVLVGSVSIGIGIDYSIHMITHINHESRNGRKMAVAVTHALGISGRAIVINVLSVALGFLVMVFSSLVPLQRFGILVALTMLISGAAAMTLLPALLVIGDRLKHRHQSKNQPPDN